MRAGQGPEHPFLKAMILAAGKGERLRPITDHTPKPLLEVGDRPLIEYHVLRLAQAGVHTIVINYAYLGDQIVEFLGNGERYGVHLYYSPEPPGALDTGGGILHARPLLGRDPCIIVNSDIYTDYPFARLPAQPDGLVHLVLVDNPPHNPHGDFTLHDKLVGLPGDHTLTYAGIAVIRMELFDECGEVRFPLAPLLRHAAIQGLATGEHYTGTWIDVGTADRLAAARAAADQQG